MSLNRTEDFTPSRAGSLPCFHVEGPLDAALERVTAAGGAVVPNEFPTGTSVSAGRCRT